MNNQSGWVETDYEDKLTDMDAPLAVVLNADILSNIFIWVVSPDICELAFKINLLSLLRQAGNNVNDIEIASVELFFKLKAIIVTTIDNRILLISP